MKYIELGIIDFKILIPLIYPIFYQIRKIIHEEDSRALFEFFTNFCGYSLSGIIYLIVLSRLKKASSKNIEESFNQIDDNKENLENEIKEIHLRLVSTFKEIKNQLDLDKKKLTKRKIKDQYLYILLLVIIYFAPLFLDSYTSLDGATGLGTSSSISLLICIFSNIFLSRIILGEKIYNHQIFSSIIILISILIVIILFLIKVSLTSDFYLHLIFILFVSSFYSLFNILEKKYYNIYMDSPYHLMFEIGLFSLILTTIYEIITDLTIGIDFNFNGIYYQFGKNIEKYGTLYILIFIGDILSAFIWLWGIQLTVYFFTPCHFIISESLSQIITTFIESSIKEYNIGFKSTTYVLYLIIVFASFVYNEVIIINICKLSKNTRKKIEKRELIEKDILLNLVNNEEERNTEFDKL